MLKAPINHSRVLNSGSGRAIPASRHDNRWMMRWRETGVARRVPAVKADAGTMAVAPTGHTAVRSPVSCRRLLGVYLAPQRVDGSIARTQAQNDEVQPSRTPYRDEINLAMACRKAIFSFFAVIHPRTI